MSTAVGELRWHARKRIWQRWSGRAWRPAVYSVDRASLRDPTPWEQRPPLESGRLDRCFTQTLAAEELRGGTVVRQEPRFAILSYPRRVSHGAHAVLTLVTGGVWGIVWIAMALARREDRVRLDIDSWGHVWVTTG
jgi:hypothetical protein